MRIEFIRFAGGCFWKDDGRRPEAGDWSFGFFATLAENNVCCIHRIRLAAARFWTISRRIGGYDEAIEELRRLAGQCGFCRLEIFQVGRIEKQVTYNERIET